MKQEADSTDGIMQNKISKW